MQNEQTAKHCQGACWQFVLFLFQLRSMSQVKDRLHRFIMSHLARDRVPLCINPMSAAYKSFARSA